MKRTLSLLALMLVMTSCNTRTNPFLTEWDTPYGIPPFEQITEADIMPALEVGIEQQKAEIDAIVNNPDEPTFDNTILAYDRSGSILAKVGGVAYNLAESDGTPSLLKIVEDATPIMTAHENDIFMNPGFFARVEKLYNQIDALGLTTEQKMYVKKLYESFVKNGIALDEAGQARMREINTELSTLEFKFGSNLLNENNAFKERFDVAVSEYSTKMTYCDDRDLRKQLFEAYSSRGNNGNEYDNKEIIRQIMALRIEKANLLGFDTPAAFILNDKMAHDPTTVDTFLSGIMDAAMARAKEEVYDMQKVMDADIASGALVTDDPVIRPWDWFYYSEKVRMQKYALDEKLISEYFQMEKVREGVFSTASRLYGISFETVENAPLYNPEVEVFKVSDSDGSLIGIIMTDYFPRSTKRGGAWMNNVRSQYIDENGNDVRPIIVNVGNFAKPTDDTPALLSIDNVETMFHEFGHALHGLLTKCTYQYLSGTSVARDFVELPSQINENWAFQDEVLKGYAKHYKTGEVIPDELVQKIIAAGNFNQGFTTGELCAASILDMKWHELTSVEGIDIAQFEEKCCKEMGLIDEIIPRYRTTYFNHIFNSGYSAGYYSYLWAEVLDKDAFELFKQNGIFDKETAMSFRHNVLEKGGTDDPMTLYKNFRGAEPDPSALLRARGLK